MDPRPLPSKPLPRPLLLGKGRGSVKPARVEKYVRPARPVQRLTTNANQAQSLSVPFCQETCGIM
jgi:hypothetical protein